MNKSDKKEIRLKIEKTVNQALKSIALIETKKSQKLVKKFSKDISSVVLSQLKKKEKEETKTAGKESVGVKKKTSKKKTVPKQPGKKVTNQKKES